MLDTATVLVFLTATLALNITPERAEFEGNLFTVFFQGQKLFQVEDDTFRDAGAVGLWTKADSVTLFDDFIFGAR